MSERVDQATYEEVKAAHIDHIEPSDIAEQMELEIEQVNEVLRSGTWKQYKNGFTPKPTDALVSKVKPAASEYFKGLIDGKYEENERLGENRELLSMQVRALMCTVRLLERKKYDLEQAIIRYDTYLVKALKMLDIDALEDGKVDFSRPNQ